MKEVSNSDELAMNIKFKEDKKKFVFSDVGVDYGNNHLLKFCCCILYNLNQMDYLRTSFTEYVEPATWAWEDNRSETNKKMNVLLGKTELKYRKDRNTTLDYNIQFGFTKSVNTQNVQNWLD